MLASDRETYHNLFVLNIIDQNWEVYPIIWNKHMTDFGKLIALRGNLYYFHELADKDFINSIGAVNRILKNGTQIDLKVDNLFLNKYDGLDSNAFIMRHIQLVPFCRRFFKTVKSDGLNLKYALLV